MKKVKLLAGPYEWRWTQRYKCKHTRQIAVLSGPKPNGARKTSACPRCESEKTLHHGGLPTCRTI